MADSERASDSPSDLSVTFREPANSSQHTLAYSAQSVLSVCFHPYLSMSQVRAVLPKASGAGAARNGKNGKGKGKDGRPSWLPGQKLFNATVLHNQVGLKKLYADLPVVDDTGSTAIFAGLQQAETWSTATGLSSVLEAKNTELVNRRAVGLSEAAQSLSALNQLLIDTKPPSIATAWGTLWQAHAMSRTCEILNTGAYPDLLRTDALIKEAVTKYLSFHTAIRQEWTKYFEIFAQSVTQTVTLGWLLQGAALTMPGTWAAKIKDTPSECAQPMAELMARPDSASNLRNLLVAELCHTAKIRVASTQQPIPETSGNVFAFSDDEQEGTVTPVGDKPDVVKEAEIAEQNLMALTAPTASEGKPVSSKRVQKFRERYDAAVQAFTDKLNAARTEYPALAPQTDGAQAHKRVLKRKLKELEASV